MIGCHCSPSAVGHKYQNVQAVESTKNHNFHGIYLLYKRFFSFAAAKFTAELKMLP